MAALEGNKLLLVSSALFVSIAGTSVYSYANKRTNNSTEYSESGEVERRFGDGGDGTADTIRTLTATVEMQADRQRELEEVNERQRVELQKSLDALQSSDRRSKKAIDSALSQYEDKTKRENEGLMSALTSLQSRFKDFASRDNHSDKSAKAVTEVLPSGFGLGESKPIGVYDSNLGGTWIMPNGMISVSANEPVSGSRFTSLDGKTARDRGGSNKPSEVYTSDGIVRTSTAVSSARKSSRKDPPAVEPYFTLPDLSALSGAITTTALIGEVFTGPIEDPFQFKVSIGRSNFAASFAELPEDIVGMIFEGYAVGKWSTSCVKGNLVAASFVFDSGEIVAAYAGGEGSRPRKAQIKKDSMGYIADEYGNPCIPGKRHTSAPQAIGMQALAAGIDGYGAALADSEITRIADGNEVSELVTGQVDKYAGAKALQAGASETASFIRKRAAQYVDTIYVPAGVKVAVHLNQQINIDKDRAGRKVRYTKGGFRHEGLD